MTDTNVKTILNECPDLLTDLLTDLLRVSTQKRRAKQPCFNKISLFTKFTIIYMFSVGYCLHETEHSGDGLA